MKGLMPLMPRGSRRTSLASRLTAVAGSAAIPVADCAAAAAGGCAAALTAKPDNEANHPPATRRRSIAPTYHAAHSTALCNACGKPHKTLYLLNISSRDRDAPSG